MCKHDLNINNLNPTKNVCDCAFRSLFVCLMERSEQDTSPEQKKKKQNQRSQQASSERMASTVKSKWKILRHRLDIDLSDLAHKHKPRPALPAQTHTATTGCR